MKIKFFILAGVMFCLSNSTCYSQTREIDSLKLLLTASKEDTNKVNILNSLGSAMTKTNKKEESVEYLKKALILSDKLSFKKGRGNTLYNLGYAYAMQNDKPQAIKYFEEAIKSREKTGDKKGLAATYKYMGFVFQDMGNYLQAIKMQFNSLKINEEINDKRGIAGSYNNIGILYWLQNDYAEALKNLSLALKIFAELGDRRSTNHPYNNMAGIYNDMGNYHEALRHYSLSLRIREEIGDENLIADSYYGFANVYQRMNKNTDALINSGIALKLYTEAGNKLGMANANLVIGEVNTAIKNFGKAKKFLNIALALFKEVSDGRGLYYTYQDLAKLDSATTNYKGAFDNYKLYIFHRDSLINQENSKKILQTQMEYDFNKKEDSLSQKQILTEIKLEEQKKQKYFYWAGLVMLGLLLVFVFLNFRNQKKINRLAAETHVRQKAELELQNQQAILNERLRISSELHDEVGATLSGIAMYSHLTKEQIKSGQSAEIEKSLNVMQQSSTQMVDKLSDIVWLINPEQDSLQKLIERLEEYATDMAAIKKMQVKITVPEKIADINLPVESRRNIYLFCKEAINNAVKYSNASLLELTIKEKEGKMEFSVKDNGRGFDAVMVRRGNGLENMQKRADEIGAKLVLQSKENEGASVSLQCKIT